MNKHLLSSTLAAILAVSLSVSLRAQSPVSGTVINVSANSSNSIGNLSSGSAVGKQVVVSSNLSNAFGEKISVGQYATGSFVAGNNDTVTLSQSVCLGAHNRVSSMGGVAIGDITLNGKVGVNIENTTSNFALAVNGGIIATEMYVMEVENWPDYVFDINYKLMPLNELKRFVNQNHHLPETPSKREASENGCNLGEMQKLLLKKIEELTLYIIQQDERISQLEKELNINR